MVCIEIDSKLELHEHIQFMQNKLSSGLYAMNLLTNSHLITLYYSLIYPHIDYGITLWGSTHSTYLQRLILMQKKAVRIISGATYNDHTDHLFPKMNILKLEDLYYLNAAKYMYALNNGIIPLQLRNTLINNQDIHSHNTRNRLNPHIMTRRTNIACVTNLGCVRGQYHTNNEQTQSVEGII